ncbi:MAG: yidC [Acidobacteria bacterium]|nr:yidC [Acidobacteriota bacterium]
MTMERRIFFAVVISLALLWSWAALAPKLFPELARPQKPVTSTTSTAGTTAAATTSSSPAAPATATPRNAGTLAQSVVAAHATPVAAEALTISTVNTPEFIARFSNRGAELISFRLKNYKTKSSDGLVELVKARDPQRTDFPFAIEAADGNLTSRLNSALYQVTERTEGSVHILDYRYTGADGVSARKTFRIGNDFLFPFEVAVSPAVPYRVAIGYGIRTLDPTEKDTQIIITGNGVVQRDESLKVIAREKSDRVNLFQNVDYVGIEDNYFLATLRPEKPAGGALHSIDIYTGPKEKRREFYAAINASPDGIVRGSSFFGPKQASVLDRYGLEKTLQFGMFGVIARFFLVALLWINRATHNYGFAIIVLTIIIKVVLYPLQHKSNISMKRMQKMQPKVEAIKARYKKSRTDPDQRQKMNTEVMKLYQQEGINPMGGCVPIVLQLPILWGFYGLLSRAIELRGAPFVGWIHDLSAKDPYYVLPLIMVVTMFIQQYITPTTVDPAQRRMFLMMPIIFGFFFKEFPSGLVLYWLVQNILTIIQQTIMNRWWENHPDNDDRKNKDITVEKKPRKLREQGNE